MRSITMKIWKKKKITNNSSWMKAQEFWFPAKDQQILLMIEKSFDNFFGLLVGWRNSKFFRLQKFDERNFSECWHLKKLIIIQSKNFLEALHIKNGSIVNFDTNVIQCPNPRSSSVKCSNKTLPSPNKRNWIFEAKEIMWLCTFMSRTLNHWWPLSSKFLKAL